MSKLLIDKILNHNVVVSKNKDNQEVIIMGKGIAFGKNTGDVIPEEVIEKRFILSNSSQQIKELLTEIPITAYEISEEIISLIKQKIGKKLNNVIHVTLSDHIASMLERSEQGIKLKNTMLWDIKHLYREEFNASSKVMEKVSQKYKFEYDENEIAFVTMHIVNAELNEVMPNMIDITRVVLELINIVKYNFNLVYYEETLTYYRFITHLRFFAQRLINGSDYKSSDDEDVLLVIKEKYPEAYLCTMKIKEYIRHKYEYTIHNDECLYLTIHIVRIVDETKRRDESDSEYLQQ